jgi:hypothetical protein
MPRENVIAALIHDRLGQILLGVFSQGATANPFQIAVRDDNPLVTQLTGPQDGPPSISVGFVLDIFSSIPDALLDAASPPGGPLAALRGADLLGKLRDALREQLTLFGTQRDAIAELIAARDLSSIRGVAQSLFRRVHDTFANNSETAAAGGAVERLQQVLGDDIGIALPFATLLGAIQGGLRNAATVPDRVEHALLSYFFAPTGFKTVDDEHIVSPVHLGDIRDMVTGVGSVADLGNLQLKSIFSKTTAERYLRDVIRVVVESAFDAARNQEARFDGVKSALAAVTPAHKPPEKVVAQFVAWFKGFSAMAESAVMRAVEVGTQGVSQFQTNPLIAAAAGTFAGTVARKLGQDSFLAKLRTELHLPA